MKNSIYGVIYKITNKITQKVYIGQTVKSIEYRFKKHVKCAEKKVNRRLYDSMNYHGFYNFIIEKIDIAYHKHEMDLKEIFWIAYYDSMNSEKGYNMTKGGGGGDTFSQLTPEKKLDKSKKISEANSGKKKPDGFAESLSENRKGEKNPMYGQASCRRGMKMDEIYCGAVRDGLNSRTEEEKQLQIERRKQTMNAKTSEEKYRSNIQMKESLSKHMRERVEQGNCNFAKKVFCVELNQLFMSKKQAAIEVYGSARKVSKINESIENCIHIDGYTWKQIQ